MENLREKVNTLEENLVKWENESPECELGGELKAKVIAGLQKDIEELNVLISNNI